MTAVMILLGRSYDFPKLDAQRKILLRFINQPAEEYFRRRSKEAKAIKKVIVDCNAGWKPEPAQNRKWNVCFIAEQLALLLAICQQVKMGKAVARDVKQQQTLRSESASGVPKNNSLKRTFIKLWIAYKKPLRNYVVGQRRGRRTPPNVLLLSIFS